MSSFQSPVFKQYTIASVSDKIDQAKSAAKDVKNTAQSSLAAIPHSGVQPPPAGVGLYARFAFAGAMCCAVTHGALTPVDVVKTRIQLEPEVYNKGFVGGFRQVIAKEGAGALLTGLGPTFAGYFLQGAFKFGGYEFWKKTFIDAVGIDKASDYRVPIYLASAGIAEFFADVALCPLEATRIRMVSQPDFATGLVSGFSRILKQEGIGAFYGGFVPILFKQIPYTMAKFGVQEAVFEKMINATGKTKELLKPSTYTMLNLGSGVIAGFAAALISQPADTMLSKVNKTRAEPGQGMISRLSTVAQQLGAKGLFAGTGARLLMVGSITAGQFAIYGDIKKALGATNGAEIMKVKKLTVA